MQNVKRGAKARKLMGEKEKISNIAKWILVAFCLQFVFYLFLVNIIPYMNDEGVRTSFYTENWYNYKGSEGDVHTEGNGIKFIYYYNMVLLCISLVLMLYYMVVYLDENEHRVGQTIKQFFKENLGLLFLVIFMGLCFFSSCFAYDYFRSFVGCYNLRDGYFSFMFYGSVLICILLMGLNNFEGKIRSLFGRVEVDPRRLITDIFLVVMVIIAGITLGDYYELNYGEMKGVTFTYQDGTKEGNGMGISVEPVYNITAQTIDGELAVATVPMSSAATVTSSVFNNSNHYAYVLSIAVIVAAVLFVKAEGLPKVWYALAFAILTVMLIVNDTFGAYLGVMIALALMGIHTLIANRNSLENICVVITISIFVLASTSIVNPNDEKFVDKNFNYIGQSISDILADNTNQVDEANQDNGTEELFASGEGEEKNEQVLSDAAGEAGSGRWKLWVGAVEIVMNNPKIFLIGAGLENLIYEYSAIGIGEGRSHNLVLQLSGTVGVPAMLCYVAGMVLIFFKALPYMRRWDMYTYMGMFVMVSYLITALTGNSAFYTSGYFYIFVGFVVVGTIALDKARKQEMLEKSSIKK